MITVKISFSHRDFKRVTLNSPKGGVVSFYIDFSDDESNKTSDELKALCYRAYKASEGKREPWEISVEISLEAMQEAYYLMYPWERPKQIEEESVRKKRRKEFFQSMQYKQRPERMGDH